LKPKFWFLPRFFELLGQSLAFRAGLPDFSCRNIGTKTGKSMAIYQNWEKYGNIPKLGKVCQMTTKWQKYAQ
jgi:hypothetical protein